MIWTDDWEIEVFRNVSNPNLKCCTYLRYEKIRLTLYSLLAIKIIVIFTNLSPNIKKVELSTFQLRLQRLVKLILCLSIVYQRIKTITFVSVLDDDCYTVCNIPCGCCVLLLLLLLFYIRFCDNGNIIKMWK